MSDATIAERLTLGVRRLTLDLPMPTQAFPWCTTLIHAKLWFSIRYTWNLLCYILDLSFCAVSSVHVHRMTMRVVAVH